MSIARENKSIEKLEKLRKLHLLSRDALQCIRSTKKVPFSPQQDFVLKTEPNENEKNNDL